MDPGRDGLPEELRAVLAAAPASLSPSAAGTALVLSLRTNGLSPMRVRGVGFYALLAVALATVVQLSFALFALAGDAAGQVTLGVCLGGGVLFAGWLLVRSGDREERVELAATHVTLGQRRFALLDLVDARSSVLEQRGNRRHMLVLKLASGLQLQWECKGGREDAEWLAAAIGGLVRHAHERPVGQVPPALRALASAARRDRYSRSEEVP